MYMNILDASMWTSAIKYSYLGVLWNKKELLAFVVDREDAVVVIDPGQSPVLFCETLSHPNKESYIPKLWKAWATRRFYHGNRQ